MEREDKKLLSSRETTAMDNNSDFEKFKDLYITKKAIELTEDEDQTFNFLKQFLMDYSILFFNFVKVNEHSLEELDKKINRQTIYSMSTEDQLLYKKIYFLYSGFYDLVDINEETHDFSVKRDGFKKFCIDERPKEERKETEKKFHILAKANHIKGYSEVNKHLQFILNFHYSELIRVKFFESMLKSEITLNNFIKANNVVNTNN